MSTDIARPARVAIIGASGTYGSGILARAEEIGVEAVVVTRSPHKFPEPKPTTRVVETQLAEVLLDPLRRFVHNRAMLRARRRWTAIASFAAWALGPAVGIGLAAHELEHHGAEPQDHSHAAQAAEAFLHGHVHEDDVDDHVHDLAPPSFTPSRLGKQLQSEQAAVAPAGSPARPASLSRADGPPPEPNALAPPDPYRLCVLRL